MLLCSCSFSFFSHHSDNHEDKENGINIVTKEEGGGREFEIFGIALIGP